jgi:hypothetical protein
MAALGEDPARYQALLLLYRMAGGDPAKSERNGFFVTNEAEQIAENKATLKNFMTNEAKDEAEICRKQFKTKVLSEAENESE